jgi:RecA/RadA recombinase
MVRDVLSSSAQARGELAAQYTALYIDDLHKLTPALADVQLRLLSSYGTVPLTGTLLSTTSRVRTQVRARVICSAVPIALYMDTDCEVNVAAH